MVQVLFLFPRTTAPAELDEFLAAFLPRLRQARGVRSVVASAGEVISPAGPPPYARVVQADFDSLADVMEAAGATGSGPRPANDALTATGALVLVYETAAQDGTP
jgi:hypothetical protein